VSVGITAASAPQTPTAGVWWWDMKHQLFKMPVLQVGASPASCWLAVGPDAWHMPGYNVAAAWLHPGDCVRFSYSAGAGLYDCTPMEPCTTRVTHGRDLRANWTWRNIYGFVQATIAPNHFGPILTYGLGHARVYWPDVVSGPGSGAASNRVFYPLSPSSQYTACMRPPMSGDTQDNALYVATGLATPDTNVTSATNPLCPVFVKLPAGQFQKT
jgi:hypothetical protein